jgi:hypothetical protein
VNDITVIAFYPGGGGHRYLRMLSNKEFSTPGITYDKNFVNQPFEARYLNGSVPLVHTGKYYLTHCLNHDQIQQMLDPDRIIFLDTDFQKSLRREWIHDGIRLYTPLQNKDSQLLFTYNSIKDVGWPTISTIDEYEALPEALKNETYQQLSTITIPIELNSAWASITWHHDYYTLYPPTIDKFEIAKENEFYKIMQTELDSYIDPLFEFCWNTYCDLGKTAPIVDLYNQHKHELVNWKADNIDTSSLLLYNDIDQETLKRSDLKSNE